MVTIVTGNIHDGKTTKMMTLFEELKGDGFVSLKNMDEDIVSGFDYLHLSTQKTGPLATKLKIEPVRDILGPYYFNDQAMNYIENMLKTFVNEGVYPIYLDEIGLLELKGKGFYRIIKWVIQNMNEKEMLFISVRKTFVQQIIKLLQLENVTVIEVSNPLNFRNHI